jgi:DNA-binding transcriptional LysR family regulator
MVTAELAEGRLVPLLLDWTPPFPGFFLYYPRQRQMPAALRAFIDFIRADTISRSRE